MELLIKELLIPGLLIVLGALSTYMTWILQHNKKTSDANAKGTMLLLRREIIKDHMRFISNNEPMTKFDYNDLQELYEAYKGLNGNGLTDKMYEELQKVPITHIEG